MTHQIQKYPEYYAPPDDKDNNCSMCDNSGKVMWFNYDQDGDLLDEKEIDCPVCTKEKKKK